MQPAAGLTHWCAQRRAKKWFCLRRSRSKLPDWAMCSAAGWSGWQQGGMQSWGPSTHTAPTQAKGRHIPPVLELRGCICVQLQPCLPAVELSNGSGPKCCCPLILSRQLLPAPTLSESCALLCILLPPFSNGAFAAGWVTGKHLSATLTLLVTDFKSITPEHRARLLPTETIKL